MSEIIRAITLHQPWASLVATGHKHFETRSWNTHHRGPLVIHAAKTTRHLKLVYTEPFYAWLKASRLTARDLSLGKVVAVCNLTTVLKCEHDNMAFLTYPERAYGDFSPGRYAWRLEDVKVLLISAEARGYQRLWWWDYSETHEWNREHVEEVKRLWLTRG